MKAIDYKNVYERIGKLDGWDFSSLNCITEGEAWDFYEEVSRERKKSDVLLDIGTGGGEKLMAISEAALLLVGIDLSPERVKDASVNLRLSQTPNVRVLQMDAEDIASPNQFFNVISCRQAPFSMREVARLLADDGVFLTQQVSENDKQNIVEAFGRGHSAHKDGTLKQTYIAELREAGFQDIQAFDYDATEYYESHKDLIFLLKHTPIIPHFGRMDDDFTVLKTFIEKNKTSKGIQTNSKRFMITARKT